VEVLRKAKRGELSDALGRLEACGADAELVGLCRDCLASAREGRPRDAAQVAQRVAAYQAQVQERLRRAELERAAAVAKAREERKKRLWMVAAVLLLLAGVAVSFWQTVRARKAESLATDNAAEADQNFQLAQQVVDQFFTRVSEKQLRDIPGFQHVRRELLQSALAYYQDFAQRHRQDSKVQSEVARALFRVGVLEHELGNSAKAIEAHEQAMTILEPLVQASPTDPNLRLELAKNNGNIGFIRWWEEDGNRKALPWFERAVPLLEELVAEDPANLDARKFLAACYDDMGQMRPEVPTAQANAYLRQGMDQRQELVRLQPEEPEYRYLFAGSWINLGEFAAGKDQSVLECFDKAYTLLQDLTRKHPQVFKYRKTLAEVCGNLGNKLSEQGKLKDALVYLRQGRDVVDQVARRNPDVIDFQLALASNCNNLAEALDKLGQQKEALENYEAGQRAIAKLAEDHLDNVYLASTLGTLYANHAGLLARRKCFSEALSGYSRAAKWQWNADSLYTAAQQAVQSMAEVAEQQAAKKLTDQQQMFQESFARAAVGFLEKAIARGFKNVAALRTDAHLDPLRGRLDFQALLK
jgi:tetratricopeptide (TPR) repeat protein